MRLSLNAVEHARRVGYLHLAYHIQHPEDIPPRTPVARPKQVLRYNGCMTPPTHAQIIRETLRGYKAKRLPLRSDALGNWRGHVLYVDVSAWGEVIHAYRKVRSYKTHLFYPSWDDEPIIIEGRAYPSLHLILGRVDLSWFTTDIATKTEVVYTSF